MQDKNYAPGGDLVRSVVSEKLADLVFDTAEVALDENLADGILKDLPIVGYFVKGGLAVKSISDALFVRKLLRFLTELKNVPPEERQKLLEKYPDNTDKQSELGENLLLAIERLDNVEKPQILARFFSAYIRSEIDYVTFTRLARSLERFNLGLMPNLRWFYTRKEPQADISEDMVHELSLTGLAVARLSGSGALNGSASYRTSPLGEAFLRIGFGIEVENR